MKADSYDIIIVGAGFAGVSTAYDLARRGGLKILILDKEASFGAHASGRNAAMLRQAVTSAGVAALIQDTVKLLQNPPKDWPQPEVFRATGSLLLGTSEQVESLYGLLRSFHLEVEKYGRGEFPETLPGALKKILSQVSYPALLHTAQDGVVDIHALLANLLHVAGAAGVVQKFNSPVTQMRSDGKAWTVTTAEGVYRSTVVVNAAGAWAGELGKMAGAAGPPLQPLRRHLYISEPLPWVEPHWPFLWHIGEEFYFRPESGGLLLCPGDEVPHAPGEPETDPRMLELLALKFQEHFPPLRHLGIQRGWACLRTKKPDGQFHLAMDSRKPGFFWVAALGGHGVSASLGIGAAAGCQIFDFLKEGKFLGNYVTHPEIHCKEKTLG